MNSFIIVKFQNFDFLKEPYFCRIDSGPIWTCVKDFLCQITSKKLSLCSWKITQKSFCQKLLKIFIFQPCGFANLWFLKHARRDAMRSKSQWGQGHRLMAWTTKRSIRGNHWVPFGCRALLGDVKYVKSTFCLTFKKHVLRKYLKNVRLLITSHKIYFFYKKNLFKLCLHTKIFGTVTYWRVSKFE